MMIEGLLMTNQCEMANSSSQINDSASSHNFLLVIKNWRIHCIGDTFIIPTWQKK